MGVVSLVCKTMNTPQEIVIFGSGHLALRFRKKLKQKGIIALHIPKERFQAVGAKSSRSRFETMERVLALSGLHDGTIVYILDDQDDWNIELSLAIVSLPHALSVHVSLYNQAIGSRIRALHPDLDVIDPGAIAAPILADMLAGTKRTRSSRRRFLASFMREKNGAVLADRLLFVILFVFLLFFLGGFVIFKMTGQLSWVDAFYYSTATVATGSYRDIDPAPLTSGMKLFHAFFTVGSIVLVSVSLALFFDRLLAKRYEIELGRRRYRLKNHVVICRLGKMGYGLAMELLRRGERVLVIEPDKDNPYLSIVRARGAKTFVGDVKLPRNLIDAGVSRAKGLYAMANDDILNLEIGLNALSIVAEMPVALRIYDEVFVDRVRSRLGIPLTFSTTAIVADRLAEEVEIRG